MKYLLLFLFLSAVGNSYAQNPIPLDNKQFAKRSLNFIENKGQITDQYGNPRSDIQYRTGNAGMSVFIGRGQLHYQFSQPISPHKPVKPISARQKISCRISDADTTPVRYSMYRLDMKLEGANQKAKVITEEKQAYYETYHTTALHSGNTVASAYNKITYKDIYPHIDWVLYIKDNTLEYDFIINIGGNLNDIKIKYNGATDIAQTDGNIKVATPLGNVTEQKLYAYEQGTLKPIAAQFKLRNTTLGFSIQLDSYKGTLVIDPQMAWGTYFGGTGKDHSSAVACDKFGNTFICGYTTSIVNIATTGAHQIIYGGFYDAFVSKFNGSGMLLWAAYYGGSTQDEAYGISCDDRGNSYVTGFTLSSNNIATPGAHQTICYGGRDVFLAKFDSSGALKWGTYYGGNYGQFGWGVTSDGINIYICGYTSSSDSIATPGSYQDTFGGHDTTENSFLAKFNSNGILLWGTYFGSAGYGCAAFACACDAAKNIYITGESYDTGIITTPGCYQDTCWGGSDCFLAKFDSSCHLLWSTYYGGDEGELAQGIVCDDSLNVYVIGNTYSANGIATAGAHQTTYGGNNNDDAFVARFNSMGALQWATYYGDVYPDEATGIVYDNQGSIYITGYTASHVNIATPGSLHDTYMGGIYDGFLSQFTKSGDLIWATYYGGDQGDGCYGMAYDGMGSLYLTGVTGSMENIATTNAFQSDYSDSGDAFLVKFDTATTGVHRVVSLFRSVNLYPDPNHGDFSIAAVVNDPDIAADVHIEILNIAAQIIYRDQAHLRNGRLDKQISLHDTAPGNYLINLIAGESHTTIPFAIQ